MATLKQIRDWYESGWNADKVEQALSDQGLLATIDVDGHDSSMTAAQALEMLQKGMTEAMAAMTNEMSALRNEVAATRQQNDELKELIENRLDERDRKLMETLRAIQESKSEENKQRRSWLPWRK